MTSHLSFPAVVLCIASFTKPANPSRLSIIVGSGNVKTGKSGCCIVSICPYVRCVEAIEIPVIHPTIAPDQDPMWGRNVEENKVKESKEEKQKRQQ